jgi:hypothetical protein
VSGDVAMGSNNSLGVWDLGDGSDTLIFTGTVTDGGSGGYVSLGLGADTLKLLGSGNGIEFDLGNDNAIDEVRFGADSTYFDLVISNFGFNDILWIGDGKYGYQYEFLNESANELDLDGFRFANNVIWSQIDNAGSADQEVMTLDTAQFEDGSLAEIDNTYGTDGEVIASMDEPSEWVSSSVPLSSTEPTPEPFFPDTNTPTA